MCESFSSSYGIVKAHEVYYRRGSSCAIATPEEVYQMGADDGPGQAEPVIKFEFGEYGGRKILGDSLSLEAWLHQPHKREEFPDVENSKDRNSRYPYETSLVQSYVNKNYWREVADFLLKHKAFNRVGFAVTNLGEKLAERVRVEIQQYKGSGLSFAEASRMPYFPTHTHHYSLLRPNVTHTVPDPVPSFIEPELEDHGDFWALAIDFGDIKPKATKWTERDMFIKAKSSGSYTLSAKIYADNISHPQKSELTLNVAAANGFCGRSLKR